MQADNDIQHILREIASFTAGIEYGIGKELTKEQVMEDIFHFNCNEVNQYFIFKNVVELIQQWTDYPSDTLGEEFNNLQNTEAKYKFILDKISATANFVITRSSVKQEHALQLKQLVIVESPYAGDIKGNIKYAKMCIRDCLFRNEAPIASHLLYTQEDMLDDSVSEERNLGIESGLEWYRVADKIIFYTDKGWSGGMKNALERAKTLKVSYLERRIL